MYIPSPVFSSGSLPITKSWTPQFLMVLSTIWAFTTKFFRRTHSPLAMPKGSHSGWMCHVSYYSRSEQTNGKATDIEISQERTCTLNIKRFLNTSTHPKIKVQRGTYWNGCSVMRDKFVHRECLTIFAWNHFIHIILPFSRTAVQQQWNTLCQIFIRFYGNIRKPSFIWFGSRC